MTYANLVGGGLWRSNKLLINLEFRDIFMHF